jgi:hypothetical protein
MRMENKVMNKVLRCPVPNIPGAFILVSANLDPEKCNHVNPVQSFLFVNEEDGIAAEWEARYGPITVWRRTTADAENAVEHYAFDYVEKAWGNWSQTAVLNECLPEYFAAGDFAALFAVLRRWASRS